MTGILSEICNVVARRQHAFHAFRNNLLDNFRQCATTSVSPYYTVYHSLVLRVTHHGRPTELPVTAPPTEREREGLGVGAV